MPPAVTCQRAPAPNPFASLLSAADTPKGSLMRRQRTARAAVLATARRLLAEAPEAFTLRRLADACGTTTQTLHNSFGRREDLLVAAFNDHTSAVWQTLAQTSSGPTMFLELAEIYYRCAVATPDFLRAMVTSAIANVRPLMAAQRHGDGIKARHLRGMMEAGVLRPGVDTVALSAHVTRLNTFMMYEWAMGGGADELRAAMIDGNRRLLLGALTPEHSATIEAWQ